MQTKTSSPQRKANAPEAVRSSQATSQANNQSSQNPLWSQMALTGITPLVQAKLTVGAPGDPYEREADAVAAQVMRKPATTGAPRCTACEENERDILHRSAATSDAPQPSANVTALVESPDAGQPLAPAVRAPIESTLGADLGNVRVHSDPRAQRAASDIQAKAFTHRQHIFLGAGQQATDLGLMAHEATHVVQQGASANRIQRSPTDPATGEQFVIKTPADGNLLLRVQPTPELYFEGDKTRPNSVGNIRSGTVATIKEVRQYDWYVVEADTIENGKRIGFVNKKYLHPIAAAKPPEPQGPPAPPTPVERPMPALDKVDTQVVDAEAQAVEDALSKPDPIAGVGDYTAAWETLSNLETPTLLATLDELNKRGRLEDLRGSMASVSKEARPRIDAALETMDYLSRLVPGVKAEDLNPFSAKLEKIDFEDQRSIFRYLLRKKGRSDDLLSLLEGMDAMQGAGNADPGAAMAAAGGAAPPPVNAGPWSPPGGQPIPFYIGNEAHVGIAANYVAFHPGDQVATNFTPMSTILKNLKTLGQKSDASKVADEDLKLKPDILNLTKLHLFEIKPKGSESLARREARMYVGLFGAAGLTISMGPMAEPGVTGAISAPAGVYIFNAPEPGVITYQYRRGILVPVPEPEKSPSKERKWRWELRPLTKQEQQAAGVAATMTLATIGMILIMIALAPVGI